MDKLKEEVEMYQLDDDEPIKNINTKLDYDDYWEKVGNITEGEGEWQVYSNLSRFVMSLGTAFNSGSEQERGFSRQSDIHRDPKRNKMSHNTLDCHMQVKYGMESKETVKKCPKCRERKDMKMMDDKDKTESEKKKFRCVSLQIFRDFRCNDSEMF